MTDVLVRDVPDEVIAAVDARAARLGPLALRVPFDLIAEITG